MADGSVEIKITGSIDRSVAASANEAKAAMTGLGDSATVSSKAMAAALAATGGNIKKITPDMLGLAAATTESAAATGAQTAATVVNTVATEANAHAAINSRSVYEGLALVHEAMAGRYTRMASTSLIFGQALAGQSAVTKAVEFATSAYGIAILGTVAAISLATAAAISYDAEEKKLTATAVGLGAQSGLTAKQLKEIGESASVSSQSIRETTKAAEAFATTGIRNEEVVKQLSNSVEAYSQLIGVKFAEAQKQLAAAMQDPIKGAKDLHEQLGILDGDQLQQIETLTALGQKDQAVAIIMQALKERIDEAKQAGVGLRGEFGSLIDVLSNVYNWIGQVTEGFGKEAETLLEDLIPALHQAGQAHRDAAAAAQQQAQNEAELNKISAKGQEAWKGTPEGRAATERSALQGKLSAARDALAVDTALHGAHSEIVKRDREAVDDYTHAVTSYLTPVEKKLKADQIDVQLAAAKHTHNKQLVADLTEQKALIEQAGAVESAADAKALAAGKGDVAGAKTFAPKGGHGPDIVSEWTEQLHAAEIASGEFFKDQTDDELKFWQAKVALTKVGSKDWLAVQSKIYEAQKTLAHQSYDEKIADLNDRLEADRDSWKKEQADWQEKLALIKSKFGEESTAYKDAHRQMEAEERQHENAMLHAEVEGTQRAIEALKSGLQAQRQIRETDARTAEEVIKAKANASVLGEVSAATRIAALHQQLNLQEIADTAAAYNAEEKLRADQIKKLEAANKTEGSDYKKLKQDEVDAEKAFRNKVAELAARARQQQIADLQALKAAYHSYIDGIVSSTVSGFTGMLAGTETWAQAVKGIFSSILSAIDQILAQAVSNWIVNLLVGQAEQQTSNAAIAASYIGVAGAAGVASWAGAPWPIDAGAPAFGAAMASSAAGFAALTSLAVGTNELPRDMLVQAHEGERIIPKADNRKLFEMLNVAVTHGSGGGAAGNDDDASGGDLHVHLHSPFIDRRGLERFFKENKGAVAASARAYVRQGGSLDMNRR